MKQHLNTLFVTTEGAYLAKDGEAVAVRVEKQVRMRLPLHNLDGLVCFGRVGYSPQLLAACAQAGITVSLLDTNGRFRAAVVGFTPGNVLLRRRQYRVADDPALAKSIATNMVVAKITNSRSVLQRGARDSHDAGARERLEAAAARLAWFVDSARQASSADQLRGVEGEAAGTYFAVFNDLIVANQEAFAFRTRNRRPPTDPANALLSFLYSMLAHDVRSACEAAGLDAAVGFLHCDRPGRPSLALDLMEEFRPFLADRLALSLINRRQVGPGGFVVTESGAVNMDERTRKEVIVAYQKRKQDEIQHPFVGERMTVGLLAHIQARLLARHLRGDIDAYPAFVWR
jgi:CRISPR-associated protein Cas1